MTDLERLRELESKATPGGWSFAMTGSEGGSIIPVEGRGRIGRIADRSFDEDQANGRLIVAAVELARTVLDAAAKMKGPECWTCGAPCGHGEGTDRELDAAASPPEPGEPLGKRCSVCGYFPCRCAAAPPEAGEGTIREAPCRHCGSDWHYSDEHEGEAHGLAELAREIAKDWNGRTLDVEQVTEAIRAALVEAGLGSGASLGVPEQIGPLVYARLALAAPSSEAASPPEPYMNDWTTGLADRLTSEAASQPETLDAVWKEAEAAVGDGSLSLHRLALDGWYEAVAFEHEIDPGRPQVSVQAEGRAAALRALALRLKEHTDG